MKKSIVITSAILGSIALIGLVIGGIFWWKLAQDPQQQVFVPVAGSFVSGPKAVVQNSTLIITWVTKEEYTVNSIYFKKQGNTFPDLGGQDVIIKYDADAQVYRYSAQFAVGLPSAPTEGSYPQYIEPGQYTYQVWGDTSDYSKHIASPVLDLDVPQRGI